ncbi:RNA polymerase sigma-70 factor [Lutibacter sp. A64]|uniref:RNA polymerase sigma factor n=1 Tax=Lutibacter sp. A64 TaxID=2918526 RepID=UPI001F06495B|nr:RNA polymerase sigma-70 factor [Lutibacter sp. A64]UMB52578.1 RNA polymerase sigma-70 factor [Lutibacter sp. A64]
MYSNLELANRIANSDQTAFNILYNKLWEKLYVFSQSIIMDEAEAKDILQEVWIDYWNRRKEISIKHNIEAYLYQAVRYKTYNILRNKKFNTIQLEVSYELSVDASIELNYDLEETHLRLNNYISKLPSRCQEIFTLSRNEGLSNKEIADKIGISIRTVENQISIALNSIKKNMEKAVLLLVLIFNL